MKVASLGSLVITCAIALASGPLTPARAGGMNVSAAACAASGAPQSSLDHTPQGIATNVNVGVPVNVVCSVPRTALTSASGRFEITGRFRAASEVSCSLIAYKPSGDMTASVALMRTSTTTIEVPFIERVTMSADELGAGYTSLACTLPANGKALLTSIIFMN